ncbi:hypothetical protein GCM10022402_42760 [Salinactinospora qingdaonensis]|uniref:Carrier domain-containing protein n=2 Tax=Salinactinospora qingdaonensis TaxID=702744 RepID=A0ABP7GBU7_9ACTN
MHEDAEREMAARLLEHPAVAEAVVRGGGERVAYLVPDARHAPLLHRACRLEAEGRLDGLSWHEPEGALLVAQLNRTETDFLYREIFSDNAYLRHGITIPADGVVVDVGANIGMFSLLAAASAPGVRIVAVEPVAELARAAAVNAELHGADVTVLNHGLGSDAGEVDFTYYPNNSVMSGMYAEAAADRDVLRSYLVTGDGAQPGPQFDRLVADRMTTEPRRCAVTTLTDVVAEQKLERIDLLKVDVEKAEADVLAGIDAATWERIDRLVVEVHDLEGRLETVLALLDSLGFETAHDRDRRLELTPCYNVYARRPAAQTATRTAPHPAQETLTALSSAVLRRAGDEPGEAAVPDRCVWVADLSQAEGYAAPMARQQPGDAPRALTEAWTELFGAGSARPEADFFDLGGDSLTAVRLLARLESQLGEEVVEPDIVFTASRFGDLATAVEAGLAKRGRAGPG